MRVPEGGEVPKVKGVNLPPVVLRPSPNFSSRRGTRVDLVVIHDTEGSYPGAVNWLDNAKAGASAHIVVREDGGEVAQLVGWEEKAWACADYNSRSDNIELAGFASKPYSVKQLRAAARITAFRLKVRGAQPKHVSPQAGGTHGFCYHSDLGAAGGGHHDPSFSFVQRKLFEGLVKFEFARGGFRTSWGQNWMGRAV